MMSHYDGSLITQRKTVQNNTQRKTVQNSTQGKKNSTEQYTEEINRTIKKTRRRVYSKMNNEDSKRSLTNGRIGTAD